MTRQNVGILIFDNVEVLDFAGPFEVFSRTRTVPGPESRRSEDSAPPPPHTRSLGQAPECLGQQPESLGQAPEHLGQQYLRLG
jgi:hypothetical protein